MPKIVDHDARRLQILDAVWRIVNSIGAEGLSIRSIAAEADLSKSNVTYYFHSRGEILAAAVDQIVAEARSYAGSRLASRPTIVEATDVLVKSVIPTTARRRKQAGVWLLLISEAPGDPELGRVLDDFNDVIRRALVWLLTQLRDCGVIEAWLDVEIEAVRLHALIDGLSIQTMSNHRILPPKKVEAIVRTHLESLAVD